MTRICLRQDQITYLKALLQYVERRHEAVIKHSSDVFDIFAHERSKECATEILALLEDA